MPPRSSALTPSAHKKNFFLAAVDRRGRRRVDVFSLAFHVGQLAQPDLKRCLDYAAACSVEDLQLRLDGAVGGRDARGGQRRLRGLAVHFPVGSPLLARLSVRGLHLTTVGAANLRSLIVVDCSRTTELRVPVARRLRSFWFSGPFQPLLRRRGPGVLQLQPPFLKLSRQVVGARARFHP
ncbi:putative FBD-associated F-box protein [Hordeum vulgare]|nr:putative FBD-associated F-box protein [Hordeum vulgare]